jgi:hypothetical protein
MNPHLDLVRIDGDVPADGSENVRVQYWNQIGLADQATIVFEHGMQSLERHRRRPDRPKKG